MPLYAAYGSNLDPEQMVKRAPHSPLWNTGWLQGWRLTFGGGSAEGDGALATVVEDPDSSVFVAVYDVPDWDTPVLDGWEGSDLGVYSRIKVRVTTLMDGEVTAWTHVLNDYEGGLPTAIYLGLIADAAEKAGAPADYVADLRTRPCDSVDL
ncbi:gamma-glutamylcyclotransferase [Actinorugispora endophytica]|uniref:gamma-glutamylcyclotransferase n=1 Tax=Actinorugispora endophytica TaxID=1605990 RepID=UPI001061986A|nr:gamma-glutamylcyclotransferase [Actinorugispora endophytica]